MASRSDKTYQDPRRAGSLSRALTAWQTLKDSGDSGSTRVNFTLSCFGESRATRVVGLLRRRRSCTNIQVHQVSGARRDTWHVHGSLDPAIRALADLEAIWTWLREAADSHQVTLLRIALIPSGA
jgi:hypothetical protein